MALQFGTGFQDITGSLGDIFGTSEAATGTTTGTTETDITRTERLKLDEAAVQKIIQDVLGGAEGLAGVFSEEQAAGIFDTSVAAQAAGNIASRLVGELAKLTAEKETTEAGIQTVKSTQQQAQEEEGLLGTIGGFFGF